MSSYLVSAQDLLPTKAICYPPSYTQGIEFVDSFKDSLELSLTLDEVYLDESTEELEFNFKEKFSNSSSVIKVTENFAIQVSVVRVDDNRMKFYLYTIHMYERDEECWEDRNANSSWSTFALGNVNGGYVIGEKGSADCIGYRGDVVVR